MKIIYEYWIFVNCICVSLILIKYNEQLFLISIIIIFLSVYGIITFSKLCIILSKNRLSNNI